MSEWVRSVAHTCWSCSGARPCTPPPVALRTHYAALPPSQLGRGEDSIIIEFIGQHSVYNLQTVLPRERCRVNTSFELCAVSLNSHRYTSTLKCFIQAPYSTTFLCMWTDTIKIVFVYMHAEDIKGFGNIAFVERGYGDLCIALLWI